MEKEVMAKGTEEVRVPEGLAGACWLFITGEEVWEENYTDFRANISVHTSN